MTPGDIETAASTPLGEQTVAAAEAPEAGSGSRVRRALLLTSLERYIVLMINFVVLALVSRLMPPDEIGLAVIGTGLFVISQTLREFGATAFIIRHESVSQSAVRSTFTVCSILTVLICTVTLTFGGTLAAFYREPELATYLQLTSVALALGAVNVPLGGLMLRDMNFWHLALINVVTSLICAIVTVTLAYLDFGALSFAWGQLVQYVFTAALTMYYRPDFWALRPSLEDWRKVITFGGYSSVTFMLNRITDLVPTLLIGRLLGSSSAGLFNRASMICDLPMKGVLQGVFPIALPALALEVREGRCLKAAYLRACAYLTAIQWPALVLLCLLAEPVVLLVLGPQWHDSVPLVRAIAIATLFSFPAMLTYPILVVLSRVRDSSLISAVALAATGLVTVLGSPWGLQGIAISLLASVPLQNAVAVWVLRARLGFSWRELRQALQPSLIMTLFTAVAAVAALTLTGGSLSMPLGLAVLVGLAAAAGWLVGLLVTRHPLLEQAIAVGQSIQGHAAAAAARKLLRAHLTAAWGILRRRARDA